MKSLRMEEDRHLYFLELPEPGDPKPDEVLIEMKYASICGFDMMMLAGKAAFPSHGALGHEASGIVLKTGSNVDPFFLKEGDRVAILPYEYCGICPECRSERPQFCRNPVSYAYLMTERVCIKKNLVYKLPEKVSLKAGCLTEPLMMAMHAVEKASLRYGQNLLILGGGAMGQLILKVARTFPIGKIVVADPHPEKREAALRFGADVVLDPTDSNIVAAGMQMTNGLGFDSIIEASGSQASAQSALRLMARGGTIVYFGLYGMDYDLNVNLMNLFWTDGYITAVYIPAGLFPGALSLAEKIMPEEVITAVFPFEQGVEAFKEKAGGKHAKVMLEF